MIIKKAPKAKWVSFVSTQVGWLQAHLLMCHHFTVLLYSGSSQKVVVGLASDFSWPVVWGLISRIFVFLFTQGRPHTQIHRMAGLGYAASKPSSTLRDRRGFGEGFLRQETLLCGAGHLLLVRMAQGWHILCFRWARPNVGGCVLLEFSIIWGSSSLPWRRLRWLQTEDPRKVTHDKMWDDLLPPVNILSHGSGTHPLGSCFQTGSVPIWKLAQQLSLCRLHHFHHLFPSTVV